MNDALRLIDLLLAAAELGLNIADRAGEIRARVQPMIDEGRNPTPEEWAELSDRINGLSEEIIEERAAQARRAMGEA